MQKKKNNDCDRSDFSLTQPIGYQIKIAGRPSKNWSDWVDQFVVEIETDSSGLITTILTGIVDQAALLGLLRRIYSLGIPLISVNCVRADSSSG